MNIARKQKTKAVGALPERTTAKVLVEVNGDVNIAIAEHPVSKGECTRTSKIIKKRPGHEHCAGKTLDSGPKIKLQLFPMDEGTRMGLEKDKYHPHLELTLSGRKKISSVLKHLQSKWGATTIAIGEPVLFPFITSGDSACHRWTLLDTGTTVGEVYADIGSPSVFRLSYGWVVLSEAKNSEAPYTPNPPGFCLPSNNMQKGLSTNAQITNDKKKEVQVANKRSKSTIRSIPNGVVNVTMSEQKPSIAVGATHSEDNEDVMDSDKWQSSALLADISFLGLLSEGSLLGKLDLSIGGLLSEASLQGKPVSNGTNAGNQASQLITESLDAFVAAQMNRSQQPLTSMLDAEDTCHAFPSNKFKYPKATEVNVKSGISEKTETELLLCSRIYSDENSLGLSGIKWSDSLGPFDLGLSSSRKIINGDSLKASIDDK